MTCQEEAAVLPHSFLPALPCAGPGALVIHLLTVLLPGFPKNKTWLESIPERDFRSRHRAPWDTEYLKQEECVGKAPSSQKQAIKPSCEACVPPTSWRTHAGEACPPRSCFRGNAGALGLAAGNFGFSLKAPFLLL